MTRADQDVQHRIPSFDTAEGQPHPTDANPVDMSSLTSLPSARGALEIAAIVGLAVVVFFGIEAALFLGDIPDFVFPRPTAVVGSLVTNFGSLYLEPLLQTLMSFGLGLSIGASIGLVLAAVITQKPFMEKVVAPYIIVMVTTPMIALVPFLMLQFGFGITPRVIAVALASGPMVMINSATGFRRTDAAMIALARSYGASTFQIFRKIRFPLALPMIIVGFMVGSIFGLLTAGRSGNGRWGQWARQSPRLLLVTDPHARVRCDAVDYFGARGVAVRGVLSHRQAVGELGGVDEQQ